MHRLLRPLSLLVLASAAVTPVVLQDTNLPKAFIDGKGWTQLSLEDFENVNGNADTWTEKDGVIICSGKPNGGARMKKALTNFEMVVEWKHHVYAGNAGVFIWCPEAAFTDLPPGTLPRSGIEVQVLDLGYEERHLKAKGKHSDWFTSHGDVFPVGGSKMTAFTPEKVYKDAAGVEYKVGNPKSSRSFPTERLTNGVGEWNHYYIRAINGEVRLWVNGVEVNGGKDCLPATGFLALESEGSKVEYRNLMIRELP